MYIEHHNHYSRIIELNLILSAGKGRPDA